MPTATLATLVGTSPFGWSAWGALQLISEADDATYGWVSENASGDYDQGMTLEDMPDFFATMNSLQIQLRYGLDVFEGNTEWPLLAARVMSGATVLAGSTSGGGFQAVATNVTTTTPTNSGVVNFSYVNTTADVATWDAAVVEIRISRNRLKGGATNQQRVYACSVFADYELDKVPPLAPTLILPEDEGAIDADADPFVWEFNPSPDLPGDTQTEFAFQRDRPWVDQGVPVDGVSRRYGIAFSPGSSLMAVARSTSSNEGLKVFNTSNWSLAFEAILNARGVAFSPNGQLLAVSFVGALPYIHIYNTSDWSLVTGVEALGFNPGDFTELDFSPDGNWFAITSFLSPYLAIYDTATWEKVTVPSLPGARYTAKFSPTSQYLACGGANNPQLAIIRTSDWGIESSVNVGATTFKCDWSPDGNFIAMTTWSSPFVRILSTSDWSFVAGPPSLPDIGLACAYSHDGNFLVVGTSTHPETTYWRMYYTSDWSLVEVPEGFFIGNGDVYSIGFSDDGVFLALGWGNGKIVWDYNVDAAEWWNGTSWQASEVFLASVDEFYQFPPGAWD